MPENNLLSVRNVTLDARIQVTIGDAVTAMDEGLQPILFCSGEGTLVLQGSLPLPAYGTKDKMTAASRVATSVSRDYGRTWQRFEHKPGEDEVNLEGGVVQLADGGILMLDTYVMATSREGYGVGELWTSSDDWRSIDGPVDVDFDIPQVKFDASTDDGGHPHNAARLHRSILEHPNGDLLTTMYTWFEEDTAPSAYMPSMLKTRAILIKSSDRGKTWRYLSTIAADTGVGTEGFTEPVLLRISGGKLEGRLICIIRTGRDLYEAHSDDEGLTWSRHRPVEFPGVDIYRTADWEGLFAGNRAEIPASRRFMIGAMVDPDLIEMENGILVCAFGVRIPEKACWTDPSFPLNGNFLAFSLDQGVTWSHVVQLTSGVMTTHYMAVRETRKDELCVIYDLGAWGKPGRQLAAVPVAVNRR